MADIAWGLLFGVVLMVAFIACIWKSKGAHKGQMSNKGRELEMFKAK